MPSEPTLQPFGAQQARELVKHPQRDANKYSRGVLSVIAGSAQYPGAAIMAASAAPRCGAGYTSLLIPLEARQVAQCHLLSVPVTGLSCEGGMFAPEAAVQAGELLGKASAVLLGPGIGRGGHVGEFVWQLLEGPALAELPLVIDADALNAIAGDPQRFAKARKGTATVLTPHGGEAARLLGRKVQDPAADAFELAEAWNCVVVLKGPDTLVASPDGSLRLLTNAGPELAKAGSGDVLAGMIGGFVSQGIGIMDAASLAVYLHGEAGRIAALAQTDISVMPEDLLSTIGTAIKELEE